MSVIPQINEKKFTNAHELIMEKFNRALSLTTEERAYVLMEKSQEEAWF
jgi:hypothetical protein